MVSAVIERPGPAAAAAGRAPAELRQKEKPRSEVRTFLAGESMYTQGAQAEALHIVVSGRVRLYTENGRNAALLAGVLLPGTPFGLDALIGLPHAESAVAETDCAVRIVPLETVERLVARQPGFASGLLEAMVRRRTAAEKRLARAIIAGVPGRLAGALLDAADGDQVDGRTRQELAEAAWTTRETATRVLFQFAGDGLVRVSGRHIDILDRERLRRLAAGAREARAA
jgi:CRP/FNR family cyclic AMP-dependent transcriptional regulator